MPDQAVLDWLLAADPAVRYLTTRDLLGRDDPALQAGIPTSTGHAQCLLAAQHPDGHWGSGFYRPKWTSSHYTLLELKNLGLPPDTPQATRTVERILREENLPDGGISPRGRVRRSDACVTGMALGYAAYFGAPPALLRAPIDFLLVQRLRDGGFNCRANRAPVTHSSVHTTTSIIEGITDYLERGYDYRADELADARAGAIEFLLRHQLFRSHTTGAVIKPEFTRFHHPSRWYYDVLRGLDALRAARAPMDERMRDALDVVTTRQRPDGRWTVVSPYPGETHVAPERGGTPSPWVTLVALRVLTAYPTDTPTTTSRAEPP